MADQHPFRLHDSDATLRTSRQRAFLGTFRIRLDNIQLSELSHQDKSHVKRLQAVFRAQGCLRLDPVNFIDATVGAATWHASSARLQGQQQVSTSFPELSLALEASVFCINGKCRVAAANQILEAADRWWTVTLYRAEEASPIIEHWRCWYSHEQNPSRGMTYLRARSHRQDRDKDGESRALKNLTPHMERVTGRLWRHHDQLAAGFDQCARWHKLWCTVNLGVLHKIIASKCDEEYLRYLGAVATFWRTVSADGRIDVDEKLIQALEGRCPYFSGNDRRYLQAMLDTNQLGTIMNDEDRAHILLQATRYPMTIPSLLTFFEDHKYIALCSKTLRRLLGEDRLAKGATLRTYFAGKYEFRDMITVQTGAASFISVPWNAKDDAFSWAYSQLWLCSMRLWPLILEEKPRKADKGLPSPFHGTNPGPPLAELARTARNLGFASVTIDTMAGPDTVQHLEHPVPAGFIVQEDDKEFRFAERCGIPFDTAVRANANDLFITKLLHPGLMPGADVSQLFVTRVFFQRLFPESERLNGLILHTHPRLGE
nr:hypothetical protein LTR18_009731 [Exophiala xenobiotica]